MGIAEQVGQVEGIRTVDLDYPAMPALPQMHGVGVPLGIGPAIHASRHLPESGTDALITTVEPKAYDGRGVPVVDLSRVGDWRGG